jgi:hypothetical protein
MSRLLAPAALIASALLLQACVGTMAASAVRTTGKVAGATVGAAGDVVGGAADAVGGGKHEGEE